MHKSDLVVAFAKEADLPLRKSEEIVNLVFETMSRALIKGARIEVRGTVKIAIDWRPRGQVYSKKGQNRLFQQHGDGLAPIGSLGR